MKGGAHPSPFAALAFPNSKKVPIHCWADREREFSSRRMANSQPYGDFVHLNRAALITRPRRLSPPTPIFTHPRHASTVHLYPLLDFDDISFPTLFLSTSSFAAGRSLSSVLILLLRSSCKHHGMLKSTQLSSRSNPRHLVGKRTAQKDTIIDTKSDSQVNSNFPYRWSPASLTFNNYFYLVLYLCIT